MNVMTRDYETDMSVHAGYEEPNKPVPESLEAEQQLLGAILVNNEALSAIMRRVDLQSEHFFEPLHCKIFEGMLELNRQGAPILPTTMLPHIPKTEMISADVNVGQYVARLASDACSIVHAPFLAEQVVKAHAARAAISFAQQVENTAFARWDELTFVDEIEKISSKLIDAVESAKAKERQRPGDAYMDRFNASSANSGAVGVAIGLKELKRVLNESVFEAGNLYGLLSSSGEGKTSLTIQIMLHALKQGHPVLFLSYDQSQAQCVAQMIAQEKGIDSKQQKDPMYSMSETERDMSVQFALWLNAQPIEIIRCQRESNARLLNYARQFVKRHTKPGSKTPLVVIDHIKKIPPRDYRLSPDKIASEINVEWKSFADETKSAVIMLNQRNGEMNKRINPRPIGKDLYGGEGARDDYDTMIYLYRPAKYRREMLATCSDDKQLTAINRVFAEFGDEEAIETVAEIGAIKVRFGDPSIRERLKFEGRYTRYVSMRTEEERLF